MKIFKNQTAFEITLHNRRTIQTKISLKIQGIYDEIFKKRSHLDISQDSCK